jgi:hypothetical protein
MTFPTTPRYFVTFRKSDTGLTPSFVFFKNASSFADISPPTITELSDGRYYFDWTFTTKTDPDIVFQIDGGASIPTEEVRYPSGQISPKDQFIDIPSSQVVTDIKGADDRSITDIAGSGFVSGTDSLKVISDNVDAINVETDAASIASAVWNRPLSSHTTPGSFGQTLQLEDSGVVQGGAAGTVTLKAGASAVTDFYKNGLITITSGTAVGQSRSITAYDGATKIATVDRDWGTNPVASDGYIILPAAPSSSLTNAGIAGAVWDEAITSHTLSGSFGQTLQLLHYGTATAGAASTITLAVGASALTDFYNNALIVITAGTGVGQARTITAYVGGTRIATVDRVWGTNPNGTSQYMIVPSAQAPLDTTSIAAAVWDETLASHLTAGSTGAKLNASGGGVSFLSNGDTVNPFIVQVASPKHTQVKITFSEPVVMTTGANGALNLANYSIPGLTLIAVQSLTAQQVMLTTSAQTPNFLYTLAVINVEDLIGNPIL